jgi:hypothetical protein
LPPEVIARQLGGTLIWKREDQGMWVALIRFDRQLEARLDSNQNALMCLLGARSLTA